MESRAWTPILGLLGGVEVGHLLFMLMCLSSQPSALHLSHCHLMSVPLVSLAQVNSEVILSF